MPWVPQGGWRVERQLQVVLLEALLVLSQALTLCTVEPLLKDTPKIRIPLYLGHVATPLYTGHYTRSQGVHNRGSAIHIF